MNVNFIINRPYLFLPIIMVILDVKIKTIPCRVVNYILFDFIQLSNYTEKTFQTL